MRTQKIGKVVSRCGMVGLATFLMACGKQEVIEATTAAETAKAVRVFAWEEYLSPEVLEKFEEETGRAVEVTHYANIDEMIQKVSSSSEEFDVLILDNYSVDQLGNSRQLAPLDHSKLPNKGNISIDYVDRAFDKGNKYSFPYMWGTTLVAYRKDMISDPQKSFSLLADPALKGKIALLDERVDCYPFALRLINQDQNTKDPKIIEQATQKLLEIQREVEIQLLTDMEIKEALKAGTIAAALLYSGDAALIAEECEEIGFFVPNEGATIWVDSFAISRDSSNIEGAHEFINFMMDAKVAAESSNFLWYATPNEKAVPFLNEDLRNEQAIYPEADVLAKCEFQPENDNERERVMNEGWQRFKKAYAARLKREVASAEDMPGS
ncbi:MAG: spermidine/putrescine ABC transporter substrate-binding protein [Verrucomicrobiales bacterium]